MKIYPIIAASLLSFSAHLFADWDTNRSQFVDKFVSKYQWKKNEVENILNQAKHQQAIIDAMNKPAEGKPWHQYRPIFLTDSRIKGGVEFWNKHQDTLAKAEKQFGVPAQIIVAIIGVETRYGGYTGKYRVLDAISTLAFDYPKRSKFFSSELEQFLLLHKEEDVSITETLGSYAGAMGMPQFISSSYRAYAIDFDGDGKRDLLHSIPDIIGSVANYFAKHGWKTGEAIAEPLPEAKLVKSLNTKSLKPSTTVADFYRNHISLFATTNQEMPVRQLELKAKKGKEYWASYWNFYVITRYNHSPLYAMAVFQLSQEIARSRG